MLQGSMSRKGLSPTKDIFDEESPRVDARLPQNQHCSRVEKHIKLDAVQFHGEMKSEVFLDWISSCDTLTGSSF